jgi:peptidase M42 family hydrolase
MKRLEIDTVYLTDILRGLLAIPSPSGYTDEVVRYVAEQINAIGFDSVLTRRGAIRALVQGTKSKPSRAFISHVDTLGAQVKRLKDNGRLELVRVGHWSSRFAEGARVTLISSRGSFRGTILPLKASGHTYNDEIDTQPVSWENVELRVDAKCYSRAQLEDLGIAVGDFVAVDPQPEFLENGYVVSRHLDDKAGVATMLAAMKSLIDSGVKIPVDTYFIFSISEEVGHGASSVLDKDTAALVTVDNGTTAPGQNSSEFGVTIAMADSSGPFDYHLTHKLLRLAAEHEIPHQRDIFRYYRCDSASAIEAGNDIRTALISFGIDASHGYERIHMNALRSVAELIGIYTQSPVDIARDAKTLGPIDGFTHQPTKLAAGQRSKPKPKTKPGSI